MRPPRPPRFRLEPTPVPWLSLSAYATYYGLHRHTVRKWMDEGLLVAWRVRHTVRIKRQPPFDKRPPGSTPSD